MKCPRSKFVDLDYSSDVNEQKKEICRVCTDYLGPQAEWGKHCDAHLICLVTGKRLGQEAFNKIPKEERRTVTHSLSEEGRKVHIQKIEDLKKKRNLPLW